MARFHFRLRLFVADEYKPLRVVSPWLWAAVVAAFAGQLAFHYFLEPPAVFRAVDLENPPSENVFRVAALGEPTTLAKLSAMRLQAFDNQPGISIPFRDLDYDALGAWLDRIVALDERAEYPHFMMSKIYSSVNEETRRRMAAEWTRRQFLNDPDNRWEWMAHATNLVKYVLEDDDLALAMARELREKTTPGKVPGWTRQIEALFLENRDEFSAAADIFERQLLSGSIDEPQEFIYTSERLRELIRNSYEAGEIDQEEALRRIKKIESFTDTFLAQFN